MRVFVSGQIEEKQRIREVFALLEKNGHEITHDWTRTDDLSDKLVDRSESGRRARKDIEGVLSCDAYVLMSDNRRVGKGMYVELGAALALHASGSGPSVYVVGPMNHLSIFYLHPDVIEVRDIPQLLEYLRRDNSARPGKTVDLALA